MVRRTIEPTKPDRAEVPDAGRGERLWPVSVRVVVSLGVAIHLTAIVSAALAAGPSSPVLRRVALTFRAYHDVIDQGYGYRYYSRLDTTVDPTDPRPWGTPVVVAEMEFDRPGGKVLEELRLPSRDRTWPRLRHQRQLDLAYHLAADPRWAASYARHLCKTRGCSRVTISSREHRIPDLTIARDAATRPGSAAIDLEGEATYGPSSRLGEFRCDDF